MIFNKDSKEDPQTRLFQFIILVNFFDEFLKKLKSVPFCKLNGFDYSYREKFMLNIVLIILNNRKFKKNIYCEICRSNLQTRPIQLAGTITKLLKNLISH